MELKIIAHIENDFPTKFGIPRQSGLCDIESLIVFEPEYRDENALRGIDGYSHLWLLWGFSAAHGKGWSPTVKPPRLGGNTRMGVFATRSPNRPNRIGLSSVKLKALESIPGKGRVLVVTGADLMNGTPIYDIKPYLSFTDSHPDAQNGFATAHVEERLRVVFPQELLEKIPREKRAGILAVLEQDPRPAYQNDPALPYGVPYAGMDVRFRVEKDTLTVFDVVPQTSAPIK